MYVRTAVKFIVYDFISDFAQLLKAIFPKIHDILLTQLGDFSNNKYRTMIADSS